MKQETISRHSRQLATPRRDLATPRQATWRRTLVTFLPLPKCHGTQRVTIKSAALLISLQLPHFLTHIQILEKSFGFNRSWSNVDYKFDLDNTLIPIQSLPPTAIHYNQRRLKILNESAPHSTKSVSQNIVVYADVIMKCRTTLRIT